jgi:hypothetical protein
MAKFPTPKVKDMSKIKSVKASKNEMGLGIGEQAQMDKPVNKVSKGKKK